MPLLERGPRDSTVLPTMKCAQCNQDVHIRLIGQHQCAQQPAVPSLPQGLRARELSSFFDAPQDLARPAARSAAHDRSAVESRMFPSAYKPSFHMYDEEVSASDDFDFDSMLQSVSRPRAAAPADDPVSPGPRRIPELSATGSSMSLNSLAAGLSPLEFSQIAGRSSPTANGFTIRHDSRMSPLGAPSVSAPASPQSAGYSYPGQPAAPASLMHKVAAAASAAPHPHPPPLARPGMRNASYGSSAGSALSLSSASLPVSPQPASRGAPTMVSPPPPLARSGHHQGSNGAAAMPANNGPAAGGASPRSPSSHRDAPRQRAPPSPGVYNGPRAANPAPRSASAQRPDHGESSSLPIGGMMRPPHPAPAQRPPTAGGATQSSSHASPAAERGAADPRLRGAARPPAATNARAQICISARRPSNEPGSASPASPRSPQSPSRSTSGSADAAPLPPAPPTPIGISRAATAPAPSAPAGAGLATNPLDVLASLVQQKPPVPQINTRVGGRSDKHGAAPAKKQQALPAAARSLKSAKLDSLLDDLLGEMQALSAEVRPESDRESMVSTASAASPVDAHAAAARDPAARSRLDSTVSSTSSSSTLSVNGAHRTQHCTACGTGIVGGAVVRSSGLRSGEIPAGTLAVEHQGRMYCVRDYRRVAQTCRGCGKQCESTASRDALYALDAWWHRKCFNCQECHQPFPDKSFYVLDQRPYCRYDYHKLNHSLCTACHEPIEGPCAQVHEGRFHPGCFACAHCAEPLCEVYYALDGLFFCERHVHQQQHQRLADKRKTVMGSIH